MELVYLWVEDYKNIKKQGFNFSPRFECKYDEDAKELTIDENKNYVSIFPDNINVNAIVGENGSGKTNLLELIFFPYKISDNNINKYIVFFKDDYNIKVYCSFCKDYNFKLEDKYKQEILNDSNIANKVNVKFIGSLLRRYKNDRIDIKIRQTNEHYKGNMSYEKAVLTKSIKLFAQKEEIILNKMNINFKNLKMTIKKNDFKDISISEDIREVFNEYINKFGCEKDVNSVQRIESIDLLILKNIIIGLVDYFTNKEWHEEIKGNEFNQIFNESFEEIDLNLIFSYLNPKEDEEICNLIELAKEFIEKIKKQSFELIKKGNIESEYVHLFNIEDEKDFLLEFIERYNIFIKRFSENYYEFQTVEIDLLTDNSLTLSDLSDGENKIYSILVEMKYEFLFDKENYFLLFDEPDNFLHPNWTKNFISILINNIVENNRNINIILTSHSPFILSDLPKENVVFLKKDEETGNCINDSDKIDINPFGANIHTLLSHGFFMKDGLMGEFAKDKIQSIIKYHEEILKAELTIEENKTQRILEKEKYEKEHKTMFWQIQSIIGDDYLKQVVKNHLIEIEKIVLGNDEAKKEEVKRLKAQIELLEKLNVKN